jgi:glycerol-3-phosphate acyltransferase PlsY
MSIVFAAIGYLCGSIPSGLIIVRLMTGKDVRQVGSGRTGGTNAFRAAGPVAGVLTALADGFKAAIPVWITTWITGGDHWAEVLVGLGAVLGHIYSLFLIERVPDEKGGTRLKFRGGAGGAPTVGGMAGLWPPILAIVLPMSVAVFFLIGYASLTTLTMGVMAILVFWIRAAFFGAPWEHLVFGVVVFALQVWALRPNIRRLIAGTEPGHSGWAKRRAARMAAQSGNQAK